MLRKFEDGVMSIFRPEDVRGDRRKLQKKKKELYDLYTSTNIITMIKSRRVRWAEHVTHVGSGEIYTRFWWENVKDRDHLEDHGVNGTIMLNWILNL
jgi:hypothetical protein